MADDQVTLDMSTSKPLSTPAEKSAGVTLDMSTSKPLSVPKGVTLDMSTSEPIVQHDERYYLTHPEASQLPGVSAPKTDMQTSTLGKVQHFLQPDVKVTPKAMTTEEQAQYMAEHPDVVWVDDDPRYPNIQGGMYPKAEASSPRFGDTSHFPIDLHLGKHTYEGAKTGLMAATAPLLLEATVPQLIAGAAGGEVGSKLASYGAKKLGADEFGQEVAGDVGGLVGGVAGGGAANNVTKTSLLDTLEHPGEAVSEGVRGTGGALDRWVQKRVPNQKTALGRIGNVVSRAVTDDTGRVTPKIRGFGYESIEQSLIPLEDSIGQSQKAVKELQARIDKFKAASVDPPEYLQKQFEEARSKADQEIEAYDTARYRAERMLGRGAKNAPQPNASTAQPDLPITPEVAEQIRNKSPKSPLGRIDLSRLEPLLNEATGGKELQPNVPLREQLGGSNVPDEERLKLSSDPRKAVLQKAQATPEEINTILQRGARIDPTSKVGLSRLTEHFGVDLGDSAIGRGKADVASGTHLPPHEVLHRIIDAGHSPADIVKAINEGKHLPPVSGGSQGADHAPAFYSKAERVANEKVSTGLGDSMLSALRNNGVKESEIQWMGLDDFLKGKTRVTKAELQNFIKDNKIELKDVDLGGDKAEQLKNLKKARDAAYVENNQIWADHLRRAPHSTELFNSMQEGDPQEIIDKMPEDLRDHASRFVVTDNLIHNYDAAIDKMSKGVAPTKYSNWTLPGEKSNYTEKLITLPNKFQEQIDNLNKRLSDIANRPAAEHNAHPEWKDEWDDIQRQKRELLARPDYKTSHFEQPNVLAHVRYDERPAPDGKKTLFVEEAQSDWHSQGKRGGYQSGSYGVFDTRLPSAKPLAEFSSEQEANDWAKQTSKVSPRFLHVRPVGAVPDAPLKSDWHELVMKRMLREAAEKGYDRLAWTTGQQQADRYDLSKHVSTVEWHPGHDNPSEGNLFAADKNGNPVFHTWIHQSQIADYIGKGPAEKLLNAGTQFSETGRRQWKAIRDLDLKIGGEWAKNLYDKAIPNFLNKYAKKWGAKVEPVEIVAGTNTDRVFHGQEPSESAMKEVWRTSHGTLHTSVNNVISAMQDGKSF